MYYILFCMGITSSINMGNTAYKNNSNVTSAMSTHIHYSRFIAYQSDIDLLQMELHKHHERKSIQNVKYLSCANPGAFSTV